MHRGRGPGKPAEGGIVASTIMWQLSTLPAWFRQMLNALCGKALARAVEAGMWNQSADSRGRTRPLLTAFPRALAPLIRCDMGSNAGSYGA